MAAVNAKSTPGLLMLALVGMVLFTLLFVVWEVLILEGLIVTPPVQLGMASYDNNGKPFVSTAAEEARLRSERVGKKNRPGLVAATFDESRWNQKNKLNAEIANVQPNACGYNNGLFDLKEEEVHPVAGKRHMITPPEGGKLSLVCCETTKGNLAMVVHHKWAPIGAGRFLDMVKDKYFDSTVPLMRCIKGFLCQFGLNSDHTLTKKFEKSIPDDPNWLPEGPSHRQNDMGVKRFAQGYLAYAGGGKNSRNNQLIMSLKANSPLAGGSPWEVPWGELVGDPSFETLSKINTEYGDNGPPQGKLMGQGMTKEMKKDFPNIDYINKCVLVHELDSAKLDI